MEVDSLPIFSPPYCSMAALALNAAAGSSTLHVFFAWISGRFGLELKGIFTGVGLLGAAFLRLGLAREAAPPLSFFSNLLLCFLFFSLSTGGRLVEAPGVARNISGEAAILGWDLSGVRDGPGGLELGSSCFLNHQVIFSLSAGLLLFAVLPLGCFRDGLESLLLGKVSLAYTLLLHKTALVAILLLTSTKEGGGGDASEEEDEEE